MSTVEAADAPVRWDLSALFSGPNDPEIDRVWREAMESARSFAKRYRGKIASGQIDANGLASAIGELEEIAQEAAKPMNFAELVFAADMADPAHGAFLQRQRERATELHVHLMFFELELQQAPDSAIEAWRSDRALESYKHYLDVLRAFRPHRLSEPEEVIIEETANTGRRAWVRFFEELHATHTYAYVDPGSQQTETMTQEQVLDLLREPDRDVRQAAADTLSRGLEELERTTTFVYNTLLLDQSVDDRLRKHPFPEHSRHLSNELSGETVDLVVRLCCERFDLVERFYSVKREILGLPELTHIDRYAPLFEASERVPWTEARSIVLNAFGDFSADLRESAEEFFERGWIDAEPRSGKTGGAFCSYVTPDRHPVVLMTYLNKSSDVMTLAHELGHGAHASLSRAQTYFNFHGTLPLAELASIFGEMLVFESLVARASPKDRVALYAEKIEGIFASVFRQATMYRFEQRCHRERRESGELTPDRFGEIWQEELQAMFGSSVKLGDQHRKWWSYVSHFFFAPFYVYAYAFGELLTLSLYEMAKQDGPGFAERYVGLLRKGGSESPQDLMSSIGVDLDSEEFWRGGFAVMERLVSEFEGHWISYKDSH